MRQKWIDNAKGIAILLVIIGHVSGNLEGLWNFKFVYGIHLVMFFLLSGYTSKKKAITREFINQRFNRLMIPYFYTCIAIIITDIFNSYYLGHNGSIDTITYIFSKNLLRSFFASGAYTKFGTIDLGTRIGAIWFLPAMFFASITFQLLLKHIADDGYLGAVTGIIAIIGYLSARFIWLPFSIQAAMMALFFIWIGYEVNNQKLLDKLKWHHYLTAQMIFLFGIFNNYCDIGFVIANISDIFISILVGLSGCLLIYWVSRIGFKGLEYIGKISLTILCTHLYALETMGTYFGRILDRVSLEGNSRVWALILLEVFFAIFTAFAVERIKKIIILLNIKMREEGFLKRDVHIKTRDNAIDVAKGIFIISMLVGHFAINRMLRNIIYSCHMVAFVFFSGYFYKKGHGMKKTVRHIIHNFLFPYVVFVISVILINYKNLNVKYLREIFIKYSMGMSFSKRIFSEIPSIGPVYFILMLFFIRIIYLFVDYFIRSEEYKLLAVTCISIGGMMLGKNGIWLPWSIDISCYAMIFYEIGIYCKKYNLLSRVKNCHIIYFVLSPVWVYMIYAGSMEIAVRNYGQYGLVIIGAVAGILLIYKLSVYISNELPVVNEALSLTGESSMILLVIHTLFGEKINNLVSYRFDRRYIFYLLCTVSLQIVLSWIIKKSLDCIKLKRQEWHRGSF